MLHLRKLRHREINQFTKIISGVEKSKGKREKRTLLVLRNAIKRERKCGRGEAWPGAGWGGALSTEVLSSRQPKELL